MKWIFTSDKLPELVNHEGGLYLPYYCSDPVLVYMENKESPYRENEFTVAVFCRNNGYMDEDEEEFYWSTVEDGCYDCIPLANVIAWMPITKPGGGEGEKI